MTKKPANHGKPVTKQDISKIKELVKHNTPTRIIGLKIQRTETAVYGIVKRAKISLEPPNRPPYGTKGKRRK